MITIGSMYSGYGGLELAVSAASALPVRTLWHIETDPDASHVLKQHRPDVPNLGADDAQDWSGVEVPDLLTAGPPCQATSQAGLQLAEADPRWRWPAFLVALRALRPAAFLVENPVGLTTHRKGETWTGILGEMCAAGYAVAWTILGACVVGAPHHRHRMFAVGRLRAHPARRVGVRQLCADRDPLLPTPMARDGDPSQRGEGSAEYWIGRRRRRPNQGIPLGATVRLLPAPERWGAYTTAVERWEAITGTAAPEPTEPTSRGGGARLAPALPEWMMGLPTGWLTDHVDRPAALRLAGNGVVPRQGAAAVRMLWPEIPV